MTNEVNALGAEGAARYSYVVHGAYAVCSCGSRQSRLIVPQCHGTYIHDMPILCLTDAASRTNVQGFGFCNSETNPKRAEKVTEILENVKKSDNFIDKVMDFFGIGKETPEAVDDVGKNVLITCEPMFALGERWESFDEKIRLQINGMEALHTGCQLICKNGGTITLLDDGQENAAFEQASAFDAASWKEGDPMPELTRKNLQALEAEIESLREELAEEKLGSPRGKAIREELEGKVHLQKAMKENVGIVEDIRFRQLFATEEERERLNQVKETVTEGFRMGTPCISADNEKLQEQMNHAIEEGMEKVRKNQTKNNWIDNLSMLTKAPAAWGQENLSDFWKKENKKVAENYLASNTEFDYPFAKEENSLEKTEIPYIYKEGCLISAKELKGELTETIGVYCSQNGFDWPKEEG